MLTGCQLAAAGAVLHQPYRIIDQHLYLHVLAVVGAAEREQGVARRLRQLERGRGTISQLLLQQTNDMRQSTSCEWQGTNLPTGVPPGVI